MPGMTTTGTQCVSSAQAQNAERRKAGTGGTIMYLPFSLLWTKITFQQFSCGLFPYPSRKGPN